MTAPISPEHADARRQAAGWALGLLGVAIFAMTLPMTRLAVGAAETPQLPPVFVTAGRAAGAALLAILYLWFVRAPRPLRADLPALLLCAAGTVIGFPLCLAWALREVPAMHAAVVTGVLPLFTAVAAAIHLRQRPSMAFWACALAGCALVLAFAAVSGGGRLVGADGWLLLAMACAAVGYVAGGQLSARGSAPQVISWVLVCSLPVTLPVAVATWPTRPVQPAAWLGFAYVTVFSMWLGFFAWYRGLALGGMVRVSQVQMLQPFLSLLMAVPIAGETLAAPTVGFALAVLAVVYLGRRAPVGRPGR